MMPARRYKVKPPEKPKFQQREMELHSAILSKCQVTMPNRWLVRYRPGLISL